MKPTVCESLSPESIRTKRGLLDFPLGFYFLSKNMTLNGSRRHFFLWLIVVYCVTSRDDAYCFGFVLNTCHGPSLSSRQKLSSSSLLSIVSESSSTKQSEQVRYTWVDRVHQLCEFRDQYGHTLVPKRYTSNPGLGNWVIRQRTLYNNKYCANLPSSLSPERVEILNSVGFAWDGKVTTRSPCIENASSIEQQKARRRDVIWWIRFQELRDAYLRDDCTTLADQKMSATTTRWLRQQRKEYQHFLTSNGKSHILDDEKLATLMELDPNWWKTIRQKVWEQRCRELLEYKEEFGDCCVPISYKPNKALANWVSNLRKQYNLLQEGKKSNLTEEKIKELNEIGFVWNRWDYEFQKINMLQEIKESTHEYDMRNKGRVQNHMNF
jgi:hypothetical protein